MKKVLVAVLVVSAITFGIVTSSPGNLAIFEGPDPVGVTTNAQYAIFEGPDPVGIAITQANA